MPAGRVYRRVRFQPLSRADVHALYAHAEPDLIRLIDDLFRARQPRNWVAFTDSPAPAHDFEHHALDERLTRNVFASHGGADR
jgi:hypothetical protein